MHFGKYETLQVERPDLAQTQVAEGGYQVSMESLQVAFSPIDLSFVNEGWSRTRTC